MTHSSLLLLIFVFVAVSCGTYAAVEAFSVCTSSSSPLSCRLPRHHCSIPVRTNNLSQQLPASAFSVRLNMFGNLFGGSEDKAADEELASFTNLAKSKEDVDIAYDSIAMYLEEWANLFQGEGGKQRGLTTPVTVSSFVPPTNNEDQEGKNGKIVESSGVKLKFKPPKDNYYSESEEREKEEGREKKDDEVSPGGVQVVAQKASDGTELRVVAERCDIEEGKTIIKEMSEQVIVDDLRKAISIWKEERK
mmetsp:Transcript_21732/g.47389  ORF Transcript_21732/g.47389 Transcript_21732/m.47389 type:complete len:249 (-) Transcript_21732:113-859(-)